MSDCSFTVEKGELFGLIGPDGAGKTTTMRSIISLLSIQKGRITVDGVDVATNPTSIRSLVGYMPQRFSLYPDLSVEQNLNFFAELFTVPKAELASRKNRLYRFSRLEPFRNRLAGRLSGGMKQKLALSCTLIHDPLVLVLDEPTTGVDPVSRVEFWDILAELRDGGVTQLVSTPYMDEAMRCDRIAIMHEGRILALDRPTNLLAAFPCGILSVRNAGSMASTIGQLPEVHSVQAFGDSLHVALRPRVDEKLFLPALSALLPETAAITSIPPSLEDVFIDLIENAQLPSLAEEPFHD